MIVKSMEFFRNLDEFSLKTAIITEKSETKNYKELLEISDDIGKQIKKRCLVFTICDNCFESVAGYIGFLRAGVAQALISVTINIDFLKNILEAYQPDYVFLPTEKLGLKNCTSIYSYGRYTLLKTAYNINYTLHENLALLLTTSGSTGSPRFVRQSFRNINNNAEAISKSLNIVETDRAITTLPMSYTYGLSIINSHLFSGASIILTCASLVEKRFWETLKGNAATTFGGVPYTYEILKKLKFEKLKLPSLRYITQAGGKLNPELCAEFAEICAQKNIKFYVMYGQVEATARISYLPWEQIKRKLGSIGIPIPGGKIWLEDENGNRLRQDGLTGELVYQGDNVTMGYAENCHDLQKGDDNKGVIHTGDLALRDEDGFYYVVGRKKRMVKVFGERINLDEVESLINQKGLECMCLGVDGCLRIYITKPDEKEHIKKYISLITGINLTGLEVVVVKAIPRNDSGKALYHTLDLQERKHNSV